MLNKLTLALSLLSLGLCVGGILLANREVISANAGGALFALSGLVGLLAVVCAVLVLFITKTYPIAMIGVLGLMPLVAVVSGVAGAFQHPRINDISTDLASPPSFTHAQTLPANQGRDLAFPAENAAIIPAAYPRVQPLVLNLSPEQAFERAIEKARAHKGWEITREDRAALTFEGVASTKMFRWRDDFIVRVSPGENGGARVDMRSKSRDGKSDLGANARRIEAYFKDLKLVDVAAP